MELGANEEKIFFVKQLYWLINQSHWPWTCESYSYLGFTDHEQQSCWQGRICNGQFFAILFFSLSLGRNLPHNSIGILFVLIMFFLCVSNPDIVDKQKKNAKIISSEFWCLARFDKWYKSIYYQFMHIVWRIVRYDLVSALSFWLLLILSQALVHRAVWMLAGVQAWLAMTFIRIGLSC